MSDLVKLKCDYFDSVIKEIKDNLVYYNSKVFLGDDIFLLSKNNNDFMLHDFDNLFIIKDNKKYIPKNSYFDFFGEKRGIIFNSSEHTKLEDGIYYKGIKVSDL